MRTSALADNQMETARGKARTTLNLLDLPDAALSTIIAGLVHSDRKMIMAACRKTFDMAMQNAEITLKVTKDSKFVGFRKVLELTFPSSIHLMIMCPACKPKILQPLRQEPVSTVAVLMGMLPDNTLTQLPASCQGQAWERITKVTIKGTMMRCLVPRFIALACPQTAHLKVVKPTDAAGGKLIFTTKRRKALPLTLCSSLRLLEIDDYSYPKLPASYHTLAELRQNLPNIDTLIFKKSCNASLITAFAEQLTRLEIHEYGHRNMDETDSIQSLVRQCSNLQHLRVPRLFLPDSTANLRVLDLCRHVTDDDMQLLLQLCSLKVLCLPALCNIQQDWSEHACPWQGLHLKYLQFTKLAYLNLSSLKKLSVGPDRVVSLPDPSKPNSLSAVQRIVAGLSHMGHIVVNNNRTKAGGCLGHSGALCWDVPNSGSEHEQTAAELIRVAAQRVGPSSICACRKLVDRPLPLAAVLQWGRMFIESICLGGNHDLQPHVWQALVQLDKLNSIVLWGVDQQWNWSQSDGHSKEVPKIHNAVYAAAQQYVIPANKRLRLSLASLAATWNQQQ